MPAGAAVIPAAYPQQPATKRKLRKRRSSHNVHVPEDAPSASKSVRRRARAELKDFVTARGEPKPASRRPSPCCGANQSVEAPRRRASLRGVLNAMRAGSRAQEQQDTPLPCAQALPLPREGRRPSQICASVQAYEAVQALARSQQREVVQV